MTVVRTDYSSLATPALIDLLFQDEDRVPVEHIDEITRRGPSLIPLLREILCCDDYWYEGQRGEFWIELHTVTILSRLGDPVILNDLVPRILTSCFADYDWLTERWADVFAGFGVAAVDPLLAMLNQHRGAFRDGTDYSAARIEAVRSLAFIAFDHAEAYPKVVGWYKEQLCDPAEDDREMLTAIAAPLLLLADRNTSASRTEKAAGAEALRTALRRGAIDTTQTGSLTEMVRAANSTASKRYFRRWLHQFHTPEQIAFRASIWATADPHRQIDQLRESGAVLIGSPPFPPPLTSSYPGADRSLELARSATSPNASRAPRVGRNDPCPCGSGRKFKKCCDTVA